MLQLIVNEVTIQSRNRWIVRNYSHQVSTGHIHAVIGPSKAGKSSLLLALGGQFQPTEGTIFIEETHSSHPHLVVSDEPEESTHTEQLGPLHNYVAIGPILNYAPLFETLTVREQLYFQARLLKQRGAKQHVEELLKKYDLEQVAGVRCKDLDQFSYLRTSIAFTRIGRAPFILLDEPDRGLSAEEWEEATRLLANLAHEGCGVIFSTVMDSNTDMVHSKLYLKTGEVKQNGHSSNHPNRVSSDLAQ